MLVALSFGDKPVCWLKSYYADVQDSQGAHLAQCNYLVVWPH